MRVLLWVEGEEAVTDIRLAGVRRAQERWIAVEVIQVSPNDRMRLKRFIDGPVVMHIEEHLLIDHLLIRAYRVVNLFG